MFSSTSVSLMVPSIAAVSILGWFPQSAQYILLMRERKNPIHHCCYHIKLNLYFRSCHFLEDPLTLSGGQLRWRKAHQSCQRWEFCGGVLHLSVPPRWHLSQSQSSTSSLPPSPQQCHGASSDQESEHSDRGKTALRPFKIGRHALPVLFNLHQSLHHMHA